MKVQTSVKKMCGDCKVIRRVGVVRIICKKILAINSVKDNEDSF